jgi:hypothetical protein
MQRRRPPSGAILNSIAARPNARNFSPAIIFVTLALLAIHFTSRQVASAFSGRPYSVLLGFREYSSLISQD